MTDPKQTPDTAASDPLYGQVYEWVKEDNTMTIGLVQIHLRLGYGRARQMVLRARQELGIPTPPEISGQEASRN